MPDSATVPSGNEEVTILTPYEEALIEGFYEEVGGFAISEAGLPPCPLVKGGKCDCPKTKANLKLQDHKCDPSSKCIVVGIVFKKGLRI